MLCLKVPTDAAWAAEALRDVDAVLVDHAHCEMKAASNALSLATRHPADAELVGALTEARSCERFKLLAEATADKPEHAAVHALWNELLASEARHYRTFVDLATRVAGGD